MPKRRTTRKESTSDSDEETGTHSQPAKKLSLSSKDLDRLVNDVAYYMIVADQKKVPFKLLDIKKNVLKENARAINDVFSMARNKLRQTFGFDVKELTTKKGHYILTNTLDVATQHYHLKWSETNECKMGLLMIILTVIYYNGKSMKEEALWQTLKKLGIDPEPGGSEHEVFGDVKKLIMNEFRQQLYLDVVKIQGTDPPSNEFQWGLRAEAEVSEQKVQEFLAMISPGEEIQPVQQGASTSSSQG